MAPILCKVKTASGATAGQNAGKTDGGYRILDSLGSVHTDAEVAALIAIGCDKFCPDQGVPCWNPHHHQTLEPPW